MNTNLSNNLYNNCFTNFTKTVLQKNILESPGLLFGNYLKLFNETSNKNKNKK